MKRRDFCLSTAIGGMLAAVGLKQAKAKETEGERTAVHPFYMSRGVNHRGAITVQMPPFTPAAASFVFCGDSRGRMELRCGNRVIYAGSMESKGGMFVLEVSGLVLNGPLRILCGDNSRTSVVAMFYQLPD